MRFRCSEDHVSYIIFLDLWNRHSGTHLHGKETIYHLHVEWSTANRRARYAVLTQLVNQKQGEEQDVVSYHINDSLNECIRAAPRHHTHIINSADWLIELAED